jgi:hypothetical protein
MIIRARQDTEASLPMTNPGQEEFQEWKIVC